MELDLHQTLNALRSRADWVGLRQVRENTRTRSLRNKKPEVFGDTFDQGIMIEVLVGEHFGYCSTQDLSFSGLIKACDRAVKIAQSAGPFKVASFSQEMRPRSVGHYRGPYQMGIDSLSTDEIYDVLFAGCDALKVSERILTTEAMVQMTEAEHYMVSSSGTDIHQTYLMMWTNFVATAGTETDFQKRSDNGWVAHCYQQGLEGFNKSLIQDRCARVGHEAVELLFASNCPTGAMDVILAPDQMMLQIHESIGHPLELDRILGDERNYAGSSFVKLEDFGQLQYGSSLMNVVFDPTIKGELASYAFDDCGNRAHKEHLIKDGVLVRGLGSLESQFRSGLPGVANFRASSWNRPPIDRMANINLEPGHTPLGEMIRDIEKGIIMHSNKSWSIDDYRNKFQFTCEYAQMIEDGRITRTVKNPNYKGETLDFWRKLKMVGDVSTLESFGTPYCGKGEPSQVIRVGHASPYCRFSNIDVFGGA